MSEAFQRPYEHRGALQFETTGSITEVAGGLAVVALSIIGLARGDNGFLLAIAGIVLGVALLAEGGAVVAEFSSALSGAGQTSQGTEFGGMTMDFMAGTAAIVLGILGVIGLHTAILLAAAIIAVGAAMVVAAGGMLRLNTIRMQTTAGMSEVAQQVTSAASANAAAAEGLAGIAGIVLGIVALSMPEYAAVLTLVGLLILGAALAMSGATLTGRIARLFSR